MLLCAQNIKKEYGIQNVLDIERLEIHDGDRIGLIGRNGAGKSTLLQVLAGRISPDSGTVRRSCEIAEILQTGQAVGEAHAQYLSRMSLRDSAVMSGGERTRMAIAAAFSKRAPLLFADEPTTNLDLDGVQTLEAMLAGYRGAILLVSHDRTLLDKICSQIWELDDGRLRVFFGNYSQWAEQTRREREFQAFEYQQYHREKKRLEKAADELSRHGQQMKKPPKRMGSSEWLLYKGTAAIQQGHVQNNVRAIESRIEKLEKKERPKELPEVSMKLPDSQKIRARYAASVRDLTVAYPGRTVLDHVTLFVESGKRTFITGDNGAGKSTLIRALMEGAEGTFITSEARTAYFSQELDTLDPDETVLENVAGQAAYPRHICRAVLANLYMNSLDMEKPVSVLSGGERVKTALAKVLVSGCNFLVLDEPTNHMDVYTMEGLERLLAGYNGTLLAVSHDRTFTKNVGDVLYRLEKGRLEVI